MTWRNPTSRRSGCLAAAIDARDTYTLGHSARVSELSTAIAREMGFGEGQVEEVEIASLFHDVGKIKMPDSILHKRGRLDQNERREMMRHPEYGAEILTKAQSLFKYIPPVRHHHDGSTAQAIRTDWPGTGSRSPPPSFPWPTPMMP